MNFLTRGINKMKANALYKERGFDFDKENITVDEVNALAMKSMNEDFMLAFDYLLYNYYYAPCAYTANNLLAGYIDLMKLGEELSENIPSFDFFSSVSKFLNQASKFEDVFDCKEYYITLAQFYLVESIDNIDKAFKLLNSVPTAFIDKDVQYLTGMLYFLLGMNDVAYKLLECAMESEDVEIKASCALIIAKLSRDDKSIEEKAKLLKTALLSSKPAIITEAVGQMKLIEREDLISAVDFSKLESVMNPELFVLLLKTYLKEDNKPQLEALEGFGDSDELYALITAKIKAGEEVDVEELTIELNQKRIEEIADSEMYKTADYVTRRMLNNEIIETAMDENDFSENDYIVFQSTYVK